jgi:hypothetical protein
MRPVSAERAVPAAHDVEDLIVVQSSLSGRDRRSAKAGPPVEPAARTTPRPARAG